MNDLELWHKVQSGSEEAFQQLFYRHHPDLVNRAYHYLRDEESAKDLAQDLFVKLWHQRQDLQIKDSLKAYLHRAVRNKCINHLQKKKHLAIDDQTEHEDSAPSAQQQLQSIDLEQMVQSAISKMPEACRTIFILRRMDELSLKEIAKELRISPKTVENQLTKARKILAQYLKPLLHLVWILLFTR